MVTIKKLVIAAVAMMLYSIFLFCGFPGLLRWMIKKKFALKPGNEIRDIWSAFPISLDFKIYLFNVTNADEVDEGKKPKLQEVGPFFFEEWKTKVDLVDRDEDDTIEYSLKDMYYFNSKKSNGLTGEEDIVIPHFLILGMMELTRRDSPSALKIIAKAVNSIFHNPPSIFIKVKAKEILFEGLPIDCTVKDAPGKMVCKVLKAKAKDLVKDGEDRYKFSLLGGKNGTVRERIRVMRGIKDYKDVGRVVEWNGQPVLTIWPEDHCNEFKGTDGTIFPPLFGPEDDITLYSFEVCRSFSAHYAHDTRVKGVNTLRYTANLGDMSTNPMEKCYCPRPDTCLTKNLFDLTKCTGVPIIVSLPHFYGSDEKYLDMVEGLQPDSDKHEIILDIEPMVAVPIVARNRLQINLFMQPIPKFKPMQTLPTALLPLFWLEEGVLLDDTFVNKVKLLHLVIILNNLSKWMMILGSIGVGIAAGVLYYKKRKNGSIEITKSTPKTAFNEDQTDSNWPFKMMKISTIRPAAIPPNLDKE